MTPDKRSGINDKDKVDRAINVFKRAVFMKRITILAIDNVLSTTLTGPMDIFSIAGGQWNYQCGFNPSPYFTVELASPDGKPIQCFNGLVVHPHKKIVEIEFADLIILPCMAGFVEETLEELYDVYPWLLEHYQKGAYIAGICSGVFLMAEAGLLDGKEATTHWSYHEQFENRYPKVKLDTNRLITRDGNVFCAGGTTAWGDLCLYFIQIFCGLQVAIECSKSIVLEMSKSSQKPFSSLMRPNDHKDSEIRMIQDWIETHFYESIGIETLSDKVKMSDRNFKRRFKAAVGFPPIKYLQMIRTEEAKSLLERRKHNVDEIARKVGYEDTSFFRKIFKRYTGLSPKSYQRLFTIDEEALSCEFE